MRIHVLSDLHLSVAGLALPSVDADVTILAGDICRPPDAATAWAAQLGRPVLYVAGNHEFYGGRMPEVRRELARVAATHGVHLLDESQAVMGGVRFLGVTLWTDFDLFGAAQRAAAMDAAQRMMRDFKVIHDANGTILTPAAARALFQRQSAWLASALAAPFAGPTVVVTHHAPSPRSVDPRYRDALTSAAFASDSRALLGAAALWVHGHLHVSFDYVERGTRVVCNPRGYSRDGVPENPAFDPAFVVEVPAAT